jgi:hypothetical protein
LNFGGGVSLQLFKTRLGRRSNLTRSLRWKMCRKTH